MNTPKPCDECIHLYYDVIQEDDPLYTAECKVNERLGVVTCKSFKHWREVLEEARK